MKKIRSSLVGAHIYGGHTRYLRFADIGLSLWFLLF
jgi:hypothetical protein